MEAVGTSSNPGDAYTDASAGKAPRIDLVYLNWDQTHNVNIVAGYNNSEKGWTATIIGTVASGFPYTPTLVASEATGANQYVGWRENSERMPSSINFDLHLAKLFVLDNIKIQAMVDVKNVFDTRNAIKIYTDTGLPNFTLTDYQYTSRIVEVSNSTEFFSRPSYYSEPRLITFGLRISYE
jgi:hypothetical protein